MIAKDEPEEKYAEHIQNFIVPTIRDFITKFGSLNKKKESLIPKNPKKADFVKIVDKILQEDENLQICYEKMFNDEERTIISEFAYSDKFDMYSICAKYKYDTSRIKILLTSNILGIFIPRNSHLEKEMKQRFAQFVPKPKKYKVSYTEKDITNEVEIFHTNSYALNEVLSIIQAFQYENINFSIENKGKDKCFKEIKNALVMKDFYDDLIISGKNVKIPSDLYIRNVGWVFMLFVAHFITHNGSYNPKFIITKKAQDYLEKSDSINIIKDLLTSWVENQDFFEFQRISALRSGVNYAAMSKFPANRNKILNTLRTLEIDKWIHIDDFLRHLSVIGNYFNILPDLYDPKIGDSRIYEGMHNSQMIWNILTNRYIRTFLLEYVATLGLIDVGLIPPVEAMDNASTQLAKKFGYISRYDGLKYIRLNKLGGYILGVIDEYKPDNITNIEGTLKVLPNLEIILETSQNNSPLEVMLHKFCDKTSEKVYKLNKEKVIDCIENKYYTAKIISFLTEKSSNKDKQIPKSVIDFLNNIEAKTNKISLLGKNKIILKCDEPTTAMIITSHKSLKDFCRAEGQLIIVDENRQKKLKNALKKLGYIVDL